MCHTNFLDGLMTQCPAGSRSLCGAVVARAHAAPIGLASLRIDSRSMRIRRGPMRCALSRPSLIVDSVPRPSDGHQGCRAVPCAFMDYRLSAFEHHGAFGVNATGLGVGTTSKFVTACLGFRACRPAAAKAPEPLHMASRAAPCRRIALPAPHEHVPEPARVPAAEAVVPGRRVRPGNRPGRRWRPP